MFGGRKVMDAEGRVFKPPKPAYEVEALASVPATFGEESPAGFTSQAEFDEDIRCTLEMLYPELKGKKLEKAVNRSRVWIMGMAQQLPFEDTPPEQAKVIRQQHVFHYDPDDPTRRVEID